MPIGSEAPEGGTVKRIVLVFVAAVALVCSASAQGWPVPFSPYSGGAGEFINIQDRSTGTTALMAAIHGGRIEAVRYLLAHGAQVNLRDVNGCTRAHVRSTPRRLLRRARTAGSGCRT